MRLTIFFCFTLFCLISVFLVHTADAQVCTPAPVALTSWWSGDGNFLDSRSRNNGTSGADFAAGRVGQAFSLDGVTDVVSIPPAANLNVSGSISGEAWVFPETFPNTYPRIFEKNNGSNQWLFTLANDGTISSSFGLNIAGQSLYAPNNTISLGQWSHIAFTYDSATGQTRLYVNGNEVAAGTLATGLTTSGNGNLLIGSNPVGTRDFDGLIDELSLYNRVLSQTEIAAIHAAGPAGKCKPSATVAPDGLIGWWAGDGNANDTSGNSNNGLVQNGAGFLPGFAGQGFRFNGSDQVVRLPHSPSLNPTGSFSLSVWIYPTTASQRAYVFTKWGQIAPWSLERAYAMIIDTSGRVQFAISDDANQTNAAFHGFFSANNAWAPNTWTHLVAVYDQTTGERRIYSNGLLVGTRTDPPITISDSIADLAIGANIADPNVNIIAEFQGLIDEAALFSRALTQAEITSITNAGIGGKLKTADTPAGFAEVGDSRVFKSRTPASAGAVVTQVGDVTLSFDVVTTGGITQQIPLTGVGLPPISSNPLSVLIYDIGTSASYTGNIGLCFNLPSFTTPEIFEDLFVFHLENGEWIDRTTTRDFASRRVCAQTTSLSPFAIAHLAPTSASASIKGRVTTADGFGIPNATITITGGKLPEPRQALSNSFGHFQIEDLTVGQTYIAEIRSKQIIFSNPVRVINVNDSIFILDFVADAP
ncbi:MAG: hypothetical protein KF762_02635 [Acidobacteria bacterium]|nr:hypothetical protein [Acidobacteriota bacterium]